MISRNAIRLAASAAALGSLGLPGGRVHAQGAPFTIRRPPDGATVREKVHVEIPQASIGEKSFVVVYLDGKFDAALDPQRLQDSAVSGSAAAQKKPESRFFTFIWDTKAEGVTDGQHSVRVVLFEPVEGSVGNLGVTQRATSEVKLTVANKIKDGPSGLRLRYKYPEGKNIEYQRTSKAVRANSGALTKVERGSGTHIHQQPTAARNPQQRSGRHCARSQQTDQIGRVGDRQGSKFPRQRLGAVHVPGTGYAGARPL